MNSSYNYANHEASYRANSESEEYNYYATENYVSKASDETGKARKTIEMIILSNTLD